MVDLGRVKLPSLLLVTAVLTFATGAARADDPDDDPDESDAPQLTGPAQGDASTPQFASRAFGPRYVIEDIVVRGNRKTKTALILAEIRLRTGDQVDASDTRVEAARYRLLSLGYFLDARLSLQRGARRGGAVLLVEVEERGTLVINELFWGTSDATDFWGGLDAGESNLAGRGINLGGGFVASTRPDTPGARAGLGVRAHVALPVWQGGDLTLSATALATRGSEPIRVTGADGDSDPMNFEAVNTRRTGGLVGVGKVLTRSVRVFLDLRQEFVHSDWPAGRTQTLTDGSVRPLDFHIHDGDSRVSSLTASVDYDTRSDPILPRSGVRLLGSVEGALPGGPGSYGFVKVLGLGSLYQKMPFGHALGFHLLAGGIAGDAPFFDRFFVGDLNLLLPHRALGINFSTLSRNVLGSGISGHRYDNFATRLLIEYAIPVWRRGGFVYGGDIFLAAGALALASGDDFHRPGGMTWAAAPVDLTGDIGLRLDTVIGVFTISIGNALGRSSF